MKKVVYGLAMIAMTVGTGIAVGPAAGMEGDAAKGKPVYEKNCLICHGPEGRGDGPQGRMMDPPAANFGTDESRNKSDAMLLKTIREGHPNSAMTQWKGVLSEEDIANVLAYIRQIAGEPTKEM